MSASMLMSSLWVAKSLEIRLFTSAYILGQLGKSQFATRMDKRQTLKNTATDETWKDR